MYVGTSPSARRVESIRSIRFDSIDRSVMFACDETTRLVSDDRRRGRGRTTGMSTWTGMSTPGVVFFVVVSLVLACNHLLCERHRLRYAPVPVTCEPGPGTLCADDGATCGGASEACYNARGIPKTIWMIWDKGWDAAPPMAKRSAASWMAYNPDWTMRALDLKTALELTDVLNPESEYYIHEDKFKHVRIEHKCDALRVVLLAKYGGLWVDASLQANRPLKEWLDLKRESQLFIRGDSEASAQPQFSVWFMASAQGSYVMQKIAQEFIADINAGVMANAHGLAYVHLGAGVMHRLWLEDEKFRAKVGPVHNANPVHCFNDVCRDAYAFKRCGRAKVPAPFDLQAEIAWKDATTMTCVDDDDDDVAAVPESATTLPLFTNATNSSSAGGQKRNKHRHKWHDHHHKKAVSTV